MVKNLPAMQESQVQSLGREDPWKRERLPIPVFLPVEFHGQRSVTGYRPWGPKELDTIVFRVSLSGQTAVSEQLSLSLFTVIYISGHNIVGLFWVVY